MLLCLGDLLEANASCSLEENGELHWYFQDESDILYGEDNKVVVSAGESDLSGSDAVKWLQKH
ncbi:MAG: hypothetical protein GX635_03285 [Synergistaceae bacterium]|nr:hypothetical protein [Synergistaceae bacterium]